MPVTIYDVRKSGDRTPFSTTIDLGAPANLAGATKTFTMKSLDFGAPVIDNATATATDVSAEVGAEALTVWRLEYAPTLQEATVTVPTDFIARFTVTYAGADTRYYPPQGEWLHVSINRS